MFLLKEIPRPFCISDVSSAGTFENFSRCFAGCCCCCFSFFSFSFFCFVLFLFHVESRLSPVLGCCCCFFFVFFSFLKFLFGMSSSFWVFIHVFGVHQCGILKALKVRDKGQGCVTVDIWLHILVILFYPTLTGRRNALPIGKGIIIWCFLVISSMKQLH